ncbi:SRPBCC family protein [Maribacter sp. 2307ULW6-5]|uniref:SRPBCC family protein n=1 Tax=Maribacter sp. 2307ULW6-5 TaxID=3386275 RepID=UPI0039BC24DC
MHIESPTAQVSRNNQDTFAFLTDLKNFEQLMPENIEKFEVINENRFLFALKGMPEIVLERKGQTQNEQLVLGAASDKLPFTLTANVQATGENQSQVGLTFNGEFNAMMGMMIKAPITKFMNTLSENLAKI